ncbi:MAG: hypothetical protein H6566_08870 [Lewinellaceae bacterium]|nr:hypothetical protein [Lewinellaceae bacterium]
MRRLHYVHPGDSLLNQLDGLHLVLDEQEITANSQVFTIVVTERKPLFAMRFEQYEPNGNIKELRWKITSRARNTISTATIPSTGSFPPTTAS